MSGHFLFSMIETVLCERNIRCKVVHSDLGPFISIVFDDTYLPSSCILIERNENEYLDLTILCHHHHQHHQQHHYSDNNIMVMGRRQASRRQFKLSRYKLPLSEKLTHAFILLAYCASTRHTSSVEWSDFSSVELITGHLIFCF